MQLQPGRGRIVPEVHALTCILPQMLIVAENPHQYVDSFSQEFLDNFLHHLKRTRGTKRVLCNTVYNEIVALVPDPLPALIF